MYRILSLFMTSTVLVGLVSCAQTAPPEVSTPKAAVAPATKPASEKPASEKPASDGFAALTDVVTKTKTAVTAGNFEKGKTEFAKFEDSWKTVEDGVKAKDGGTSYGTIEKAMDKVDGGLKAKDAAATLAGLKVLSESLVAAAKP
jgi:hypothetical protein